MIPGTLAAATTTSTTPTKKSYSFALTAEHDHQITELLAQAFEPERQQYLHDIQTLSSARDRALESTRKVLATTTNKYKRDLPNRALTQHHKIKKQLEKAIKRIRDLEITNRTLNVELNRHKHLVHQTRETSRRQLNVLKSEYQTEVEQVTQGRNAATERCRRLYDSMLSAEVTIQRLQKGSGSSELQELRQRCEENEQMSEQIREAAYQLKRRATNAEEKCKQLAEKLSTITDHNVRTFYDEDNATLQPTDTPLMTPAGLTTTTTRGTAATATATILASQIKSVRSDHIQLRQDVMNELNDCMKQIQKNTTEKCAAFVHTRKVLEELARHTIGTMVVHAATAKASPLRKRRGMTPTKTRAKKNRDGSSGGTTTTPGSGRRIRGREILSSSASSKSAAELVAQKVSEALLSTSKGKEIELRQKLKKMEKRERNTSKEHQEQIEPLKHLVAVLRAQLDTANDLHTKQDQETIDLKEKLVGLQQQQQQLHHLQYVRPPISVNQSVGANPRTPYNPKGEVSLVNAVDVREAYQEDLLSQSKEIASIIDAVRTMKMTRFSAGSGSNSNGNTAAATHQMVVWNGMLEKQNITLEKELVASQGELVAVRQSLTRSNAEALRLQTIAEEANHTVTTLRKRAARLKKKTSRNGGGSGGSSSSQPTLVERQMTIADTELRASMSRQIELLEAEKASLTRELKTQTMIVHNLTQYQDMDGDEF